MGRKTEDTGLLMEPCASLLFLSLSQPMLGHTSAATVVKLFLLSSDGVSHLLSLIYAFQTDECDEFIDK